MESKVRRGRAALRGAQLSALWLALSITACESARPTKPALPARIPPSQFIPLAFTAVVDLRAGGVTITAPHATNDGMATLSRDGNDAPNLSLLGGDAVRIVPTNYASLPSGTFAPRKVRVTFDLTIENKLPYVALTTPTWPQPPAPGVILFPLDYRVSRAPGDTTGGADSLFVPARSASMIVPSAEWNGTGTPGSGAPFNFFNEEACAGATTEDCFRWVAFEDRIYPTSRSATHTVGFDIDDTVTVFSARMIVAGDLVAQAPLLASKITGSVTSSLGGVIPGVTLTVTTGQSATTSAFGAYTIAGLPPGPQTVTASGVPAGCTPPPPQSVSLLAGDSVVTNFTVTCTTPTGTLVGTLTSSFDGAVIAGATVVASTGGSAVTNASGVFLITNAGAGTGTLSVTGMLARCALGPTPFDLTANTTTTVNLIATCAAPAGQGSQ